MMDTWKKMIAYAMSERGDAWKNVVAAAPPLDTDWHLVEFNAGYGLEEGCPFLLWTHDYVYFPVGYDGSEYAGSAPRNPVTEPQEHVGG